MHDEDQGTLQAVEDGEDICEGRRALAEQEGPKHPHQSQYAHLGDGSDCESSAVRKEKQERRDLKRKTPTLDLSCMIQMLLACVENPLR